jgi:hypothetical protein
MGSLFEKIVAFPNLILAAKRATKGKRFRPDVAQFTLRLEEELHGLRQALLAHSYKPGAYRIFVLREKKPRLISAAPFRDRVVHHALCNVVEPLFERGFVYDSYACRKGKGTHAAIERASHYARKFSYVLKADIAQYFPSIDHAILFDLLKRHIWDREVLWLLKVVIDGSNPQPEAVRYFPDDDLFTPWERRRGLPIGNQTSQFFANVYLNGLDHFAKEQLRVPGYIRYGDDMLVFGHDKDELHEVLRVLREYGASLRVRLHERKCVVMPTRVGCTFLGQRIFPTHRRLDPGNVCRFRRRLQMMGQAWQNGEVSLEGVRARVQSWIGHARHADTARLRAQLFRRA